MDIVGAGDSTTAGIVCALLAGMDRREAAATGNLVASITVQQLGTTGTASPAQVLARWVRGARLTNRGFRWPDAELRPCQIGNCGFCKAAWEHALGIRGRNVGGESLRRHVIPSTEIACAPCA